jgi:hypothetical protein
MTVERVPRPGLDNGRAISAGGQGSRWTVTKPFSRSTEHLYEFAPSLPSRSTLLHFSA